MVAGYRRPPADNATSCILTSICQRGTWVAGKETTARIKIDRLLETAGWRFFPESVLPANMRLEPTVAINASDLKALGEDFEKASHEHRTSCRDGR